jgi:hypothetical protein
MRARLTCVAQELFVSLSLQGHESAFDMKLKQRPIETQRNG